jgi:nitrate reductase beta subunit
VLPAIDDYYEPFTYDYQHLHNAPEGKYLPTARPRSLISGERMDKINWGPNWEELLGGEFEKRARDRNFEAMQKEMYGQFENTFMMYLRACASTASTRAAWPPARAAPSTSVRKMASY